MKRRQEINRRKRVREIICLAVQVDRFVCCLQSSWNNYQHASGCVNHAKSTNNRLHSGTF